MTLIGAPKGKTAPSVGESTPNSSQSWVVVKVGCGVAVGAVVRVGAGVHVKVAVHAGGSIPNGVPVGCTDNWINVAGI